MKAVSRSLMLVAWAVCASPQSMAAPQTKSPGTHPEIAQDFFQWLGTDQGQKASLAQMLGRCERVLDAAQHLNCAVSVIARMFEVKAANQMPDYFAAIKRKHAAAIAANPELNVLFSMFGNQSLSILRATGDFTVKNTSRREVLRIHRYSSDALIAREVLPFIDVDSANGHSARFVLDTGAPQTRVNDDTARQMGIKLLPDSHYVYSTFYGESELSARLGILDAIKVGSSEFHNVLVFVSDRDNLLGLDLISKLGRLKITGKNLELNPTPVARCESPVVYTRQDINQRLVIAARLDNRLTQAIIDTGNVDYLTSASPGEQVNAVRALSPGNASAHTFDKRYQTFNGMLNLPGQSMTVTYKYHPGFTIPPSWVFGRYVPSVLLGWRAFKDFELSLDIEAGRSCLNKPG